MPNPGFQERPAEVKHEVVESRPSEDAPPRNETPE
jgi:hypothetical protein